MANIFKSSIKNQRLKYHVHEINLATSIRIEEQGYIFLSIKTWSICMSSITRIPIVFVTIYKSILHVNSCEHGDSAKYWSQT